MERKIFKLDEAYVSRQIKSLSILNSCKMLQKAFVHRLTLEEMAAKFRCLLSDEASRGNSAAQIVREILSTQTQAKPQEDYQLKINEILIKDKFWKQLEKIER